MAGARDGSTIIYILSTAVRSTALIRQISKMAKYVNPSIQTHWFPKSTIAVLPVRNSLSRPHGCVSRPERTLSRPKFLNKGFWGINRFLAH